MLHEIRLIFVRRRVNPTVCALLILSVPHPAMGQGANHGGGHAGDGIRCASGDFSTAVVACTEIIEDKRESDENHAIAIHNRGFSHQQSGELDRAIRDYTAALDLSIGRGVQAKIRLNRGILYYRKGDDERARADYDGAISLDSKLSSAYVNRATIFMKHGDDVRAIRDLDQALLLNPRDHEIRVSREALLARRGGSQRADDSSTAPALVNQCAAHLLKSEWPDAIADCTSALAKAGAPCDAGRCRRHRRLFAGDPHQSGRARRA
jgi:tetratricopeptide (TPR) repeat protein